MNKALYQKYLKQQTTLKENRRVMKWFADPRNEDEALALFKSGWEGSHELEVDGSFDQLSVLGSIKSKMTDHRAVPNKKTARQVMWSSVFKIAAMLVLAIGLGFVIYNAGVLPKSTTTQVKWIEKITAKGQRSTITMSDGSKVIMNADSKIRYAENYGEKMREVILEGEAFFDVAKDPDRPFKVRTVSSITTALGTSFNVSAYSNDPTSTISLATGKVEVIKTNAKSGELEAIFLEAGEEAVVNGKGPNIVKRDYDPKGALSWKDGILYFDNTSIEETFKLLERWYDVSFVVNGTRDLKKLKGTGEFKNEKLENVLRVLSYTMDFKYNLKGKKIIIDLSKDQ